MLEQRCGGVGGSRGAGTMRALCACTCLLRTPPCRWRKRHPPPGFSLVSPLCWGPEETLWVLSPLPVSSDTELDCVELGRDVQVDLECRLRCGAGRQVGRLQGLRLEGCARGPTGARRDLGLLQVICEWVWELTWNRF